MKNIVIILLLIILIIINIQSKKQSEPLKDYSSPIMYRKTKNEILNPQTGCNDGDGDIYDCSNHKIYGGENYNMNMSDYTPTIFNSNPHYSDKKVMLDLKYFNNSSNIEPTAIQTGRYYGEKIAGPFLDGAGNQNKLYAGIYLYDSTGSSADENIFIKAPNDYMSFDYSIIVDMDANDTCFLRWGQSGGSNVADLSSRSFWSGALIC